MPDILRAFTPLTHDMIDEIPVCDIHVHLPGAISPYTAWTLGLKNKFFSVQKDITGDYVITNGPNSLSIDDPHEHYIDIFNSDFHINKNHIVKNLSYNIDFQSFKSFDRVMATVQGHRHPPGGIQTKDDLIFILDEYLKVCLEDKMFHTELQQNIKIAYLFFPNLEPKEARKQLYLLLFKISEKFFEHGITLKFLHCFNKTKASGEIKSTHERALEAYEWLKEAHEITPGLFVGIESAGHEKDESGWPIHLKAGYDKVVELGLGCEAHGGEGIGVEHMLDVVKTLPITRLAHGFQVIEDLEAINYVKEKDITLVMMPMINLSLGLCIHVGKDGNPLAKSKGGKRIFITELKDHPFFTLFRKHKLKIALSSDNPEIGGVSLKKALYACAGLDPQHPFPKDFHPLKAEELAQLCQNTVDAAFIDTERKACYNTLLSSWMKKFGIVL